MKRNNHQPVCAVILGLLLITANLTLAETAVKEERTTTMAAGTISEFGSGMITIKPETALDPVRYSTIKTTIYVDEGGAPVSMDIVKSGLPVTVYYVKVGDKMVASKIVARKPGAPVAAKNAEADNTARNIRHRQEKTKTPPDQGSSRADVDTTAQIRKEIFAGENMSVNAQNVKIITNNGRVTLRGPVNTEEEKRLITEMAVRIATAANVDNQLEVKLTTGSKD